jgi:hypothetical protein
MSTEALQGVADRIAIEQVLARYCRGIDRCDAEELKQVFAARSTIDFGDGAKPRDETIEGLMAGLGAMRLTHHNIGNVICEIAGESAKAETYCVAYHWLPGDPEIELVVGGRYMDRLSKIDGRWWITERRYIMDWNRQTPSTMQDSGGLYDTLLRRGARKPDDESYEFWKAG